jgi:hypothetical protein
MYQIKHKPTGEVLYEYWHRDGSTDLMLPTATVKRFGQAAKWRFKVAAWLRMKTLDNRQDYEIKELR